MVAVRIHCVGYSYITLAIIGYHSNSVGVVFFDSIDELAFVKCYGVVVVAVRIHCVGYSYVSVAIIGYHSNSVGVVFLDSIDELAFVKCYGVVMVAVRIHCVGHSYITLAIINYCSNGIGVLSIFLNKALQSIFINTDYIILISQIATAYAVIYSNDSMTGFCSSNGIGIIFLNSLDELIFVNAYGVVVITVIINHFGNIYITLAVSLCGSNCVFIILLYKITQLIAVDINLIRMVAISAFIGDFQHIGFRFYGSNSIGILCCFLDIALQSVLIDTDLIILTVFLTFHAIIYSNDIMNRFSSCNGVGIILLYKVTQLIAVDINLIRMIAICAFIGDC